MLVRPLSPGRERGVTSNKAAAPDVIIINTALIIVILHHQREKKLYLTEKQLVTLLYVNSQHRLFAPFSIRRRTKNNWFALH